jgi:hypothetical protein
LPFGDLDTVLSGYRVLRFLSVCYKTLPAPGRQGRRPMYGLHSTTRCRRGPWWFAWAAATLISHTGVAASLDDDIESLSAQVNEHLASVRSLERQLLYPTHTRLSVFLSLAERETLDLDAIELFLDDQPVASHLYQNRERSALEAGGVQELYIGNLATGQHRLKAVITARAADKSFVRREAVRSFIKPPGALVVELTVAAPAPDYQPRVTFTEWK